MPFLFTKTKPFNQKPQNTITAAPQQTNQPIRTEETHRCAHTHTHTAVSSVSQFIVKVRVFVSSSGCLNLFLSHYLATLRETQS